MLHCGLTRLERGRYSASGSYSISPSMLIRPFLIVSPLARSRSSTVFSLPDSVLSWRVSSRQTRVHATHLEPAEVVGDEVT